MSLTKGGPVVGGRHRVRALAGSDALLGLEPAAAAGEHREERPAVLRRRTALRARPLNLFSIVFYSFSIY